MPRFELNVVVDCCHYCKIILPETTEREARAKARTIRDAFVSDDDAGHCQCSLTCWVDTGHEVAL